MVRTIEQVHAERVKGEEAQVEVIKRDQVLHMVLKEVTVHIIEKIATVGKIHFYMEAIKRRRDMLHKRSKWRAR